MNTFSSPNKNYLIDRDGDMRVSLAEFQDPLLRILHFLVVGQSSDKELDVRQLVGRFELLGEPPLSSTSSSSLVSSSLTSSSTKSSPSSCRKAGEAGRATIIGCIPHTEDDSSFGDLSKVRRLFGLATKILILLLKDDFPPFCGVRG